MNGVASRMVLDKHALIMDLAKRRGFFWPSFEIYGGVGGFIDLGPLGSMMLRRLEEKWLNFFVKRHGFIHIVTPIVMPEKVFEASGHVQHFKDPVVECLKCGRKYRADHVIVEVIGEKLQNPIEALKPKELEALIAENDIRCPECGGEFSGVEYASTMFKTTIGPYIQSVGYGRPEAAQGIFINFKRMYELERGRLPFAVAQIGRVLRNEISPRQGPIRLREFTIMEFEFFYNPQDPKCPYLNEVKDEALPLVPLELRYKGLEEPVNLTVEEALRRKYILAEWSAYFMALSKKFVTELGVPPDRQRFHEKLPTERAHYSIQTYDHEVLVERFGWVEVAGHANRGDYDLRGHMSSSGEDLTALKPYEAPITKKVKKVRPNKAALGPVLKDAFDDVVKLLEKIDVGLAEKHFRELGYFEVAGFKITPNQVEILEVDVKEAGYRFIPHVVEPSFGAERLIYATLEYAYTKVNDRVVLKLPKDISPYQAAVFPLVSKDGLPERAMQLYRSLLEDGFDVEYDESGSIGRRYARADEIGIPIAITVDYQTLQDGTVTLRDRDTWKQVRCHASKLNELLRIYLRGKASFGELGPPYEPSGRDILLS